MGQIIKISDFDSGKYPISTNQYTERDLLDYIDTNERNYLEDLLGIELAADFFADLDPNGVPQNTEFKKIFDRLAFEYHSCNFRSEGIVDMLKGFIWAEFTKDQNIKNTIAGSVKQQLEVAEVVSHWDAQYQERYNLSIIQYRAIQLYICLNPTGFEKFNGQSKEILTFF